jgi:hypothetical protein
MVALLLPFGHVEGSRWLLLRFPYAIRFCFFILIPAILPICQFFESGPLYHGHEHPEAKSNLCISSAPAQVRRGPHSFDIDALTEKKKNQKNKARKNRQKTKGNVPKSKGMRTMPSGLQRLD